MNLETENICCFWDMFQNRAITLWIKCISLHNC